MKKLLILILFLNASAFSMDVWTRIQRWIIENPSAEQPKKTTPLPTLPTDIQTTEIIKQLLNVASTRKQALTLLSNYALVNKEIANYVKNNKKQIQQLINKKFGVSLNMLASGNYDDPETKSESLRILEGSKAGRSLINAIENADQIITSQNVEDWLISIRMAYKYGDYEIIATILGAFNNFFSQNRFTFTDDIGKHLLYEFKYHIKEFGKDEKITQISNLLINTVIKIFGASFVNDTKLARQPYSQDRRTLLDWARASGNKEAIKYLESIKKLG
ncbi:MAG: hypothetical protein ACOYT8_06395 [Candidatus Dependentiae bacterium]